MRLPPLVADVVERYLIAIDAHSPGLIQALYLTGSVALDDFRPGASDIDFLAVTTQRLDTLARTGLQRVLARVSAERRKPFFDGTYVTWSDLKADPAARRPSASVHQGRWNDHDPDSCDLVTWHTLAWHGVAVRGPEPRMVEVWTDRSALEAWTLHNMATYWRNWHARARRLPSKLGLANLGTWGPSWGVLGLARQHFTVRTGDITSEYGAGLYAREVFPSRWHSIIDECLRIRGMPDAPSGYRSALARRRDTLAFMELVMSDVLGDPPAPSGVGRWH